MNTPHPNRTKADSQCGKILALLEQRRGEAVSLFDLWQVSGSMAVHSRISDLRERGYNISCVTKQTRGRVLSEYTLH